MSRRTIETGCLGAIGVAALLTGIVVGSRSCDSGQKSGAGATPLAALPAAPATPAGMIPLQPIFKPVPRTETERADAVFAELLRVQSELYGPGSVGAGMLAVKTALRVPSSAEFGESGWEAYGCRQWKAFGTVESKNAFGVRIADSWTAVVRLEGGDYRVLYLRIGKQESGTMPELAQAPARYATPGEIAAAKAAALGDGISHVEAALKKHQELAAAGDDYGLLRMGERYLAGDGVERSEKLAREYFEKAAAKGNADAAAALAKLGASQASR
jgi:hypothetical protein